MTREEQIERVVDELRLAIPLADWPPHLNARELATAIVDALAQPVEVTDEMVERAAAALVDPPDRRIDWTPHYAEFSEDVKDLYRQRARAALRAALEASD